MDYVKIKENGQVQTMPNPFRVVVANPSEEMKAKLADAFNWLEKVDTQSPEFNQETQYLTSHYEAINGKAVRVWVVCEKEDNVQNEIINNADEVVL